MSTCIELLFLFKYLFIKLMNFSHHGFIYWYLLHILYIMFYYHLMNLKLISQNIT